MNRKIKQFLLVSSLYLLAPGAYGFDLANTPRDNAPLLLPQEKVKAEGEALNLVRRLTEQLGVTPTQASGGVSAMFGYARNALGPKRFAPLENEVLGLSSLLGDKGEGLGLSASLLSGLDSLREVRQVFATMGLSSGAVEKFTPLVLGFLRDQGLDGGLLATLEGLWDPAGRP